MSLDPNSIASRESQLTPPSVSLARTYDNSISGSTEVTFNTSAKLIRVFAGGQDVFMKWGTDNVSSSDFDEIIPAGQICDFLIPIATHPGTRYTAANFIERDTGGYLVVIEK